MIKRPFEQWLYEDVQEVFGIKRVKNHPILLEWLKVENKQPLPPSITRLQLTLEDYIQTWNEDELKMMFIAPLLVEIDFNNSPHYKVFTQRLLHLKTDTVEASGKVEWLVSTGEQTPKKPFFFLQEYKPEKFAGSDPLGQLLVAMVDAQLLNEEVPDQTLYGCYTLGRLWFFVMLKDKEYSVSRAYDATQTDDLTDMVAILHKVKQYIHQDLGLPYP